jgi:hypothetical protein
MSHEIVEKNIGLMVVLILLVSARAVTCVIRR